VGYFGVKVVKVIRKFIYKQKSHVGFPYGSYIDEVVTSYVFVEHCRTYLTYL